MAMGGDSAEVPARASQRLKKGRKTQSDDETVVPVTQDSMTEAIKDAVQEVEERMVTQVGDLENKISAISAQVEPVKADIESIRTEMAAGSAEQLQATQSISVKLDQRATAEEQRRRDQAETSEAAERAQKADVWAGSSIPERNASGTWCRRGHRQDATAVAHERAPGQVQRER